MSYGSASFAGTVGVKLYCRYRKFSGYCLLGAEDTVAGVAQTRNDVAVIVQLLVDCADEDLNVRMSLLNRGNTFRCTDEVHQLDVLLRRGA